jgi:hypothetical protein
MEQGYWTKAPAKTIYSLMTRLYRIANLIFQPFECLTLCFTLADILELQRSRGLALSDIVKELHV